MTFDPTPDATPGSTPDPTPGSPGAPSRRRFLRQSGLALAFAAGGGLITATPAEARARGLALKVLGRGEADILETTAEALVPGAREAGIAHFIDQQLGAAPEDNLLMLKYLGFAPGDHRAFYQTALANIDTLSRARFDRPAAALTRARADQLVAAMASDDTPGWEGPPASLVHFALRADGVDVVYGTAAGMERLDMPRMAHIEAPTEW